MVKKKVYLLVLCGGEGRRLWPLSIYESKNFIRVFGKEPIKSTIERFKRSVLLSDMYFVSSVKESKKIRSLLKEYGIKNRNIIVEPQGKNTASAVLLGLTYLKEFGEENIVIITPVDHIVTKINLWHIAIRKAIDFVHHNNCVLVFGVGIRELDSNFGYVVKSKFGVDNRIFKIEKFLEKPSEYTLRSLPKNKLLINCGLFISKVSVLLDEYRKYYSYTEKFLLDKVNLNGLYAKLPSLPFDKVIMENTQKGYVWEAKFGWHDFGNWPSLKLLLSKKKTNFCKGEVFFFKSKSNFVYNNTAQKIVVLGMDDTYIINTKDYILVANSDYLPYLKKINLP